MHGYTTRFACLTAPGKEVAPTMPLIFCIAAASMLCLSASLTPQVGVMSPTMLSATSCTSASLMHLRSRDGSGQPGHVGTSQLLQFRVALPDVVISSALHQHGHHAHPVHVISNALRALHAALHPARPFLRLGGGGERAVRQAAGSSAVASNKEDIAHDDRCLPAPCLTLSCSSSVRNSMAWRGLTADMLVAVERGLDVTLRYCGGWEMERGALMQIAEAGGPTRGRLGLCHAAVDHKEASDGSKGGCR